MYLISQQQVRFSNKIFYKTCLTNDIEVGISPNPLINLGAGDCIGQTCGT